MFKQVRIPKPETLPEQVSLRRQEDEEQGDSVRVIREGSKMAPAVAATAQEPLLVIMERASPGTEVQRFGAGDFFLAFGLVVVLVFGVVWICVGWGEKPKRRQ